MEKDRSKRYASAAEMKADLQQLKKETESGLTRAQARENSRLKVAQPRHSRVRASPKVIFCWGSRALLITVLAAVGTWFFKHRAGSSVSGQQMRLRCCRCKT